MTVFITTIGVMAALVSFISVAVIYSAFSSKDDEIIDAIEELEKEATVVPVNLYTGVTVSWEDAVEMLNKKHNKNGLPGSNQGEDYHSRTFRDFINR